MPRKKKQTPTAKELKKAIAKDEKAAKKLAKKLTKKPIPYKLPQNVVQHAEVIGEATAAAYAVLSVFNAALGNDPGSEPNSQGVAWILAHPDCTPEQSHKQWVHDNAGSKHEALVPYADLPYDRKVKAEMFNKVVKTIFKKHKVFPFFP